MTSEERVKAAVNAIEASISKDDRWTVPEGVRTPINVTFVPELDDSQELESKDIALFQETIGMLGWATEPGQVDTPHEINPATTSGLSQGKSCKTTALNFQSPGK